MKVRAVDGCWQEGRGGGEARGTWRRPVKRAWEGGRVRKVAAGGANWRGQAGGASGYVATVPKIIRLLPPAPPVRGHGSAAVHALPSSHGARPPHPNPPIGARRAHPLAAPLAPPTPLVICTAVLSIHHTPTPLSPPSAAVRLVTPSHPPFRAVRRAHYWNRSSHHDGSRDRRSGAGDGDGVGTTGAASSSSPSMGVGAGAPPPPPPHPPAT